jgi:hypothetical protein
MKSGTSNYPTCVSLVILMTKSIIFNENFSSVMYLADADRARDEHLLAQNE